MALAPEFLEELRARLPLAEVIGRRVKLMRAGREHKGLCPFHKEKTPSFTVVEDKGFFHCFGCGAHGDVITFVMRTENLSFFEAVERLAQAAGLEVPRADPAEQARARERTSIGAALEATCAWFETRLWMPEGKAARDYLIAGRGLDEATIRRFRLGFAPSARGGLQGALAREGVGPALLVEAGLLKAGEEGREPYEYFRGRITFPITDRRGRVIAFGGRVLGAGEPKYLNSPETALFQKGRVLYGLAQAREAALAAREVVVVEGYMDVIALSRAGIENVVAPLGTALTEAQVAELWRLAPAAILCFDGDDAGARAAQRATERALPLVTPERTVRFALLPPGRDPDALVAQEGPAAMRRLLDGAGSLLEFVWRVETEGQPAATPEERARIRARLEARVRQVADRTLQRQYFAEVNAWFRDAFGPGRGQGGRARPGGDRRGGGPRRLPPPPRPAAPAGEQERMALALLLRHPALADEVAEELAGMAFRDRALDRLRQALLDALAGRKDLDSLGLIDHLQQHGHGRLVDGLLDPATYRDVRFLRGLAGPEAAKRRWRGILIPIRLQTVKAELEQAKQDFNANATPEAQTRISELRALELTLSKQMIEAGEGGPDEAPWSEDLGAERA